MFKCLILVSLLLTAPVDSREKSTSVPVPAIVTPVVIDKTFALTPADVEISGLLGERIHVHTFGGRGSQRRFQATRCTASLFRCRLMGFVSLYRLAFGARHTRQVERFLKIWLSWEKRAEQYAILKFGNKHILSLCPCSRKVGTFFIYLYYCLR